MANRVLLTKLKIKNLGPIQEDEVSFSNFTFSLAGIMQGNHII